MGTLNGLIDRALAEVGYLEKKNGNVNYLYHKTANAGSANYTKYGKEMHDIYPSVMDYPAYWCDAFVDWLFYKEFGIANAKGLLGGNFDDYTVASAQLYKNKGAWHTKNPKVGDQIFFTNGSRICHTGLVVAVTASTVTTVEGNTSGASTVVSNGGGVCKKTYAISYSRIAGYGRPNYAKYSTSTTQNDKPKTDNSTTTGVLDNVRRGQKWLNKYYPEQLGLYCGGLITEDNQYGTKTRKACVAIWKDVVNRKYGASLTPKNSNFLDSCKKVAEKAEIKFGSSGTLVLIAQLILSAKGFYTGAMDAEYGSAMEIAVATFQQLEKLESDGVIGSNTWYKLFN